MNITLPLDQMSTSDKLRALEQIWEDLCRSAESIPSPSWHADVLRAREGRVSDGSSKFVAWGSRKRR